MKTLKNLFKKMDAEEAFEVLREGRSNKRFEKALKTAIYEPSIEKVFVDNKKNVQLEMGSGRIVKVSSEEVIEVVGCLPAFFERSAR